MSLEAEVAYLHLIDGVRQNEVPAGYSVHEAPRRCARGRDADVLMVSLHLTPGAPKDLMDVLVGAYFGTPGSVTAAARAAFAAVAARLHDFNRYPPASGPVQGGLCCAVLRHNDLYVALSGGGHVLVIHPSAVEHFPDPAGDPLPAFGLERSAEVRYFHTTVAASDFAVFTDSRPEQFEGGALTNLPSTGLESAVARLTRMAGANASAMVVQFAAEHAAPAKTRPSILATPLRPAAAHEPERPAAPAPASSAAEPPARPEPVEPAGGPTPEPAHEANTRSRSVTSSLAGIIARVRAATSQAPADDSETLPDASPAPPVDLQPAGDETDSAPGPAPLPPTRMAAAPPNPAATPPAQPPDPASVVQIGDHVYEFEEESNGEEAAEPEPKAPLAERLRGAARGVVARLPFGRAGEAVKQGSETLGESLAGSSSAVLRRVLPEGTIKPDAPLRIPERTLMIIAIVLPMIIALAVGAIYIQRGRNEQYQQYLDRARVEAALARTKADGLEAKPHWQAALGWLDQAERIFPGQPEAAALRSEAQAAVDLVDNVQRVALQPLLPGGFASGAQITEIVVSGSEVYALDSVRQAVYRALLTDGDKYLIDRNFQCQLGIVGTVTIKRIVDIVWLNTPNIVGQPALMAVDEDGDLMYCKTDGTAPEASSLIPPDVGWRTPKAAEIFADRLYVFDPGANDIWTYARVGGVFSERPTSYFTGVVLDLSNAIFFTIAQGDVYILRADGRMTYCSRDLTTLQTNCTDNALYSDARPGHASGDRIDDAAAPLALFYDPPPEPSVYMLDGASAGAYQLSLKLVLQKVYRSRHPLPAPVSAIAIGPDKELYVAAGNNVYWGGR